MYLIIVSNTNLNKINYVSLFVVCVKMILDLKSNMFRVLSV